MGETRDKRCQVYVGTTIPNTGWAPSDRVSVFGPVVTGPVSIEESDLRTHYGVLKDDLLSSLNPWSVTPLVPFRLRVDRRRIIDFFFH